MASNTIVGSNDTLLGRVKWFNNKAGYGFITVTDGPKSGSDIFVHHSVIVVSSEQYKYLVQGEYIQFKMVSTPGGVHECQAGAVCGINGGKLMCETRRDFRMAKDSHNVTKTPRANKADSTTADSTWVLKTSGKRTSERS